MRSFDQFHDVSLKSDYDIARMMQSLGIDIAIDLAGHTENNRLGILAARAAPLQVNYLGYSATTGADFIDYIVADRHVLPFSEQLLYSEKIVHLPDCFLFSEGSRDAVVQVPSRTQAGLPEQGFVFCCFNNSWKIRRDMFHIWMLLLNKVEGSVLWLAQTDDDAVDNLRREAVARGIEPDRLIFAPKVPHRADHISRHALADLYLDTLPYNAHSTVSDALWAGLPVLTCKGGAMVSRIAGSVLHAVGLPELVTNDLEEYQGLALRLANDSSALAGIRSRLAQNRSTFPLFDSHRSRRHLEAAYTTMLENYRSGGTPRSFTVDAIET